jgi:hypothetical protein
MTVTRGTKSTRIRLDLLAGRLVRDADGRKIGRIHDVRAEQRGDDLLIVEYLIGAAALLERYGVSLLMLIGVRAWGEPRRIPWDQLDISDPERPRLIDRTAVPRSRNG